MKMNTKGKIVLFSIMTVILIQFVSVYYIQITNAASSCCGVSACPAPAGGAAAGNGSGGSGSGFSAGLTFNSVEARSYAINQYKETFENKVDRFELLQMSARNMDIFTENPVIWIII